MLSPLPNPYELSIHRQCGGGYLLWDQQAGIELSPNGFPFRTYDAAATYAAEIGARVI